MKRSKRSRRVKVSADGRGVVSHAGVGMLRELAQDTGLVAGVNEALVDTYAGPWMHAPGQVFADMAVAIADGGDCVSHIEVFGDQHAVCGPVASMPTAWRMLDRIDEAHLPGILAARAAARERAWAAGAGPDLTGLLRIDFDATVTISHAEDKENAAKTWKRTFGFHPLLAFLDRPEVSGGEALAGLLRAGNAGSNTAADHIAVLERALASLPAHARPRPGDPDSVRVVARSDSAGATLAFAQACRERGVWFSFGFPVDARIQVVVDQIPDQAWESAIDRAGGIRDGAWVADITGMLDLSSWPAGSKVIVRAERPHPGAQLRFTDVDGHRITAFITDIPDRVIPGQTAGLELHHRQHARVEDRIRQAKATGLRNLPCRGFAENTAWLETLLAATDLVCWAKILGFTGTPVLARAEIATFRNLVLHVGARITRGARQVRIRIDETCAYAHAIAQGWLKIRAAFT
ncbi:IS1380 family transposase [Kibdelosporangium philippinense]|uniref:IS1380 family transposase n=1 Tax=Kibdelosporangium philippinense TaxID=211113 RepID=A0ABS8ZSP0_9PSEU|nr:IS1380 family transposase [Kibdelosporangium philippinense]MCE7003276.1 IS1380 family transposase [Kibdelosporangium philippinense]MCE7006359.1 IS1380 family transposase [Kibdelosporangium philippinense]MCE7006382.1 IS1380 family transposase [Kibdelosporangium philippinense]MCE7006601.1 IS1380 family transposase [Kibdelosporangium philippinense]MCE7006895.1 IS1380 family transposase [Kibdelosporangium philippinense]